MIETPYAIYGKNSSDRIFTEKTFSNAVLYVPQGTLSKYKSREGWKDFAWIQEGLPTGVDNVKNDGKVI